MESTITLSLITAVLTLILIITGILLRKKGEPYKTSIFTIHVVSIISVIVFIVLIYIQHLRTLHFSGIGLFLYIFSSIFMLISFITGALLSFKQFFYMRIFHRASSWLTLILIPVIWLVCH